MPLILLLHQYNIEYMTLFVIYQNLSSHFLRKSEDLFLGLCIYGRIRIKSHFHKVAYLSIIDRLFGLILIEPALWRIRPSKI